MAAAEDNTIVLTFKYRLLPNKRQHKALADLLESQRQLYNGALEHRITSYQRQNKTITLYTQQKELTELRQEDEYAAIPANLQRWTLRRLDEAYQAFFRRVKIKGEKAGFPSFRGENYWKSFGFLEFAGIVLRGKRFHFKGIPGGLRMHLHRPLPEGKPLSCTFTRDTKGWYVCLQYRVPCVALPATGQQVGIDMGLKELAVLSTGEAISNPRMAKRSERKLRRRQRALSRCKKGSNRRRKVKLAVTRCHAKVANSRRTYLHQVSTRLVRENDLIAIEDLGVKGLAASMLAKPIGDAGLSTLRGYITYKAAVAGRQLVAVNPKYTSQTCPECGVIVKKTLKQRTHRCDCGCVMDRDHAAASVVLQRAVVGAYRLNVGQWPVRADRNIALPPMVRGVTTAKRNPEAARALVGGKVIDMDSTRQWNEYRAEGGKLDFTGWMERQENAE